MIVVYAIIALFIGWIWIDYYRLIEIYDKTNLKYILFTFLLGGCSIFIVFGINNLLEIFQIGLTDNFTHDFLYCVFKIGAMEELAKTIPFLIIYFLFKKQFNEPIDYLAFISISALGFSAVENTFYFYKYGARVIDGRAILASVGHMFDSSLIAYGIIIVKFRNPKYKVVVLIGFFFLAALSHGFYDFWLLFEYTREWGAFITIFYFLITISIFATILNNAMNNSSFFSYKKIINSGRVMTHIFTYYLVLFFVQLIILTYEYDLVYALGSFNSSVMSLGFILVIAVVRLSRFKLIKERWERVRIELPFGLQGSRISIKGNSYNEAYINEFYEEYFYLLPVSSVMTEIPNGQLAFIERKLFLKDDETFYFAKLFGGNDRQTYETRLFKPKTNSMTMIHDQYPIVAILKIDDKINLADPNLCEKDFEFQEWGYLKPIESEVLANFMTDPIG